MRGLKQDHSARVIIAGHAFVQNLRRGHYELAVDEPATGACRLRSPRSPWRSDLDHRLSSAWGDQPDATAPSALRRHFLAGAPTPAPT